MTVIESQTGQNVLPSSIKSTYAGTVYQDQIDNSTSGDAITAPYRNFQNSSILPPSMKNSSIAIHSDNREFVCGWGAAFINICVTFPINKLMFRQMLHGISTGRALNQLKKEGIKTLYRGILPPLCQKTISTSIMFGMNEKYLQLFKQHYPSFSYNKLMASAAALAGCTEAILCPLERIQTILQDKKFHGMYRNTWHCAKALRQFGIGEYYRGLSLILIRNSSSNIMFFGLRKQIKDSFPNLDHPWYENFLVDFLSGAFLGAFISTVVYPTNVVKAHQQTQIGGRHQSVFGTFSDVYESRGRKIRNLFKGVHVNYTRALVSWGIINASYEALLKLHYR